MDSHEQLSALLDLAESLGVEIRWAPPAGGLREAPGGALVRLRDKEMLFLDPTAAVGDQIEAAARALADRRELQARFLPPEIRRLLDEAGS